MSQRIRVTVVRGGPGDQFHVSLRSGERIAAAIDRDRYEVLDVVVSKAGEWLAGGRLRQPHEVFMQTDVIFVALAGTYGEGGAIEHLLDAHGMRYTGSKPFPSTLAQNKVLTKDALSRVGIKMPQHMIVTKDALRNLSGAVASIVELFGPRYVVKPVSGGSSVGTLYAESPLMLERALQTALSVYDQVLVEEYIDGKEATCGIVEHFRGERLYALPPVEVMRQGPLFEHSHKFGEDLDTVFRCPGRFSNDEKAEVERIARLAHESLGLSHYSRSDFIVARDGIYFLEVNARPSLTLHSPIVKALEAVGSNYDTFIDHVLTLAYRRGDIS